MTTTTPNLPAVAVEIRKRRASLNITQRTLAIEAGVSLSTLQNMEGGLVPRLRSSALGRILTALESLEVQNKDSAAGINRDAAQDKVTDTNRDAHNQADRTGPHAAAYRE